MSAERGARMSFFTWDRLFGKNNTEPNLLVTEQDNTPDIKSVILEEKRNKIDIDIKKIKLDNLEREIEEDKSDVDISCLNIKKWLLCDHVDSENNNLSSNGCNICGAKFAYNKSIFIENIDNEIKKNREMIESLIVSMKKYNLDDKLIEDSIESYKKFYNLLIDAKKEVYKQEIEEGEM